MAAYDLLIGLVKNYFGDIGYNKNYIDNFFTCDNFKEIVSIRLANANLMIRNKTIRSSHQTHIAITGEAIDFSIMKKILDRWIQKLLIELSHMYLLQTYVI